MVLLTLVHYTERGIGVSEKDRAYRFFSTHEKAEDWLKHNGFSYQPRTFLKGDPFEWCHLKEEAWDFIDVEMRDIAVDDEAPFDFDPIEAPWRATARRNGFIDEMREQGFSPEQIKVAYEQYFGEKCGYKLDL